MPYTYTHGSGTENDPYQVWTAADLDGVRDHLSSYFIQMDDIDLSGIAIAPIGHPSSNFTGRYNGNNFNISNLDMNYLGESSPEGFDIGLFRRVFSGKITNVRLVNAVVKGSVRVGSLAGTVTGDAEHPEWGGVDAPGIIENCSSVNTSCTGHYMVGGLVGSAGQSAKIGKSFATGEVIHEYGAAFANGIVGGFVGYLDAWEVWKYEIENCYARCSVGTNSPYDETNFGGFVGNTWNDSVSAYIKNCYATGSVTDQTWDGSHGGFCGREQGDYSAGISNSYYDSETSGMSDTGKGEPRTTAQMVYPYSAKHASGTYVDWEFEEKHITDLTGYDFVFGVPWLHDHDASVNGGYPILFRPEILFAVYSKIVAAWTSGPAWIKKDGQWKSVTDGWIKEGGAWKPIVP